MAEALEGLIERLETLRWRPFLAANEADDIADAIQALRLLGEAEKALELGF